MLQVITGALSISSAILGAFAICKWLSLEFEKPAHKPPLPGVSTRTYRLLERARTRIFRGSKSVRFTIFAIDGSDPSYMRAIARLGNGRAAADSTVRFKRGEGLAGKDGIEMRSWL
jgi:hypothetical protein